MSMSKQKNATPTQQAYQAMAKRYEAKRPVLKKLYSRFFCRGFYKHYRASDSNYVLYLFLILLRKQQEVRL